MSKETGSYVNIAPIFIEMGRSCDIPTPPGVEACWNNLGITMKAADHQIDSTGDKASRILLVECATSFLSGECDSFVTDNSTLNIQMQDLRTHLRGLGKVESFVLNLKNLCKVTEKLREAKSLRELSILTRLEGQITANLYTCLLPRGKSEDAKKLRKYIRLTTRLGRVANNFDTAVDLPDDSANMLVCVKPSLLNRALLVRDVSGDAFFIMRNVNPRTIVRLKKSVKKVFDDNQKTFGSESSIDFEPKKF